MKFFMCVHRRAKRLFSSLDRFREAQFLIYFRNRSCPALAGLFTMFWVHSLVAEEWAWNSPPEIPYLAEESDDGTVYQFKFMSTAGVNYYIQSSENLLTWADDVFYRGMRNTITHPLYPLPQNDGGSSAPTDTEDLVELKNK